MGHNARGHTVSELSIHHDYRTIHARPVGSAFDRWDVTLWTCAARRCDVNKV